MKELRLRVIEECVDAGYALPGERSEKGSALKEAADRLDLNYDTLRRWYYEYKQSESQIITREELPPDDLSIHEILDFLEKRNSTKIKSTAAKQWQEVRINSNEPCVIAFVGDPHLDSPGADLALLREHIRLMNQIDVYAFCVGDLHDNWVGSLMRLYANSDVSRDTALKLIDWFMNNSGVKWLGFVRGNHDCLSNDTQVLTKRGWLDYQDIKIDDLVWGVNPETNLGEWQNINDIIVRDGDGYINILNTSKYEMAVTDNHRIISKNSNKLGLAYEYFTVSTIPNYRCQIPLSLNTKNNGIELTDDQIRFAAWCLTDGSIDDKNIVIYQSKQIYVEEIRNLLKSLEYSYTESIKDNSKTTHIMGRKLKSTPLPSHEFYIKSSSRNEIYKYINNKKILPEWTKNLNNRQFDVFLETLVKADGTMYYGSHNTSVLYKSKEFLDQIQILCLQHGWTATLKQYGSGHWRLNLHNKDSMTIENASTKFQKIPYEGEVWCLSVKYTNFMVRRNGKPFLTGNCWNNGAELLNLINKKNIMMEDWEIKTNLTFPSGLEIPIWISHDFKGKSSFNKVHGLVKAARERHRAKILVAGHTHDWGYYMEEMPDTNRVYHAIRSRGYKFNDEHALVNGFPETKYGATMCAVIDPLATDPISEITVFPDLEKAILYKNALGLNGINRS